jgi:hypothetical protein
MPIVRYIAFVGTSLLALLFVANWFLPEPPPEPAHEAIDKPIIRIASVQHLPERVVIDTNQPTIVPPPTFRDAVRLEPSPLQSYASTDPPQTGVDVDRKKRKVIKRQMSTVTIYRPPLVSTPVAASGGSATTLPPTKLSLRESISHFDSALFLLRQKLTEILSPLLPTAGSTF